MDVLYRNENDDIKVYGNKCKRGEKYAKEEIFYSLRVLTSTVKVDDELYIRLPVKTSKPVEKKYLMDVMKEINKITIKVPIEMGDIIIKNVLNLGVDIISTKSIK